MEKELSKYVAIAVSEDEMSADLFLSAVEDPGIYNVDEIIEYIKDTEGIIFGVKPSVIMEMINQKIFKEQFHVK